VQVAEGFPLYPESHTGVHVVPSAEGETQFPGFINWPEGKIVQVVEVQIPETDHAVLEHVAERVPENPELQVGVHVVPEAEFDMQFPAPPLAMDGVTEQDVLKQTPLVTHTVLKHEAERVPENPVWHVGVHWEPSGEGFGQFPGSEFAIAGAEVQAVLVQTPLVTQTPLEHVAERTPMYPVSQTGVQVAPEAVFVVQSPAMEWEIEGRVAQGEPPATVQAPVVPQEPSLHVAERVPMKPV
jgi:hypothetical protein